MSKRISVNSKIVLMAGGLAGLAELKGLKIREEVVQNSRIGAGVTLPTAPRFIERGTIYMACSEYGYIGLVRLVDDRLNVAAALDIAAVRTFGGPGTLAAKILDRVNWPNIPEIHSAQWRGTRPLSRRTTEVVEDRLFVVGDSAGYVEPFTGEGMAWAIGGGIAVATLVLRGIEQWDQNLGKEWHSVYQREVEHRQSICRWLAWGLRRPVLMQSAIKLFDRQPWLAKRVFARLNRS